MVTLTPILILSIKMALIHRLDCTGIRSQDLSVLRLSRERQTGESEAFSVSESTVRVTLITGAVTNTVTSIIINMS